MFTSLSRSVLALGLLVGWMQVGPGPAAAQEPKPGAGVKEAYQKLLDKAENEYRTMFRRPETVPEFWTAINFEVDVGKYDVAALLLKQMLDKEPAAETDKELVKIEEVQGLSTFLRLRRIRQWSDNPLLEKEAEKNVETLIGRVTTALEQHLADPQRMAKLIQSLNGSTAEERAYAFTQLNRARDRAGPFLVEALRTSGATPLHERIRNALIRLDDDVMPPVLAALTARDARDAQDIDLRMTLLDVIKARGEKRAVPELWQLAGLSKYPPVVRERARETLGYLLQTKVEKLPPPRVALVEQAERYAHHQVRYPAARLSLEERKAFQAAHKDQQAVVVWKAGDKGLTRSVLTLSQADAYNGLRFTREALEIEPGDRAAQTLFLVLTLEGAYGANLDQVLLKKAPPALEQLLATVDSDLLNTVLERGLTEGDLPVVLGALQAVGDRGDLRLARPAAGPTPPGLVRALYYPDRRVQMAAVRALLRMPSTPAPAGAARVVEVLRRFLAADPVPKALLLFVPQDRHPELRKAFAAAGFEPVFAAGTKEAFDLLHRAADVDVVLIDYRAPQSQLPYLLSQLRSDDDAALLPVLLLAPPERMRPDDTGVDVVTRQQFTNNLRRLADRHRNVWVVPESEVLTPGGLKTGLPKYLAYAALPPALTRVGAVPGPQLDEYAGDVKGLLSPAERKQYPREALNDLWRMARGELPGYDLQPARAAVVQALRADDTAVQAAEILGRLPGTEPQQRLAAVVLDPKRGKLRLTAAIELNHHAQQFGVVLPQTLKAEQLKRLRAIADNPAEDADLRTQVALLVGRMGETPRQTGVRLYQFTPDAAVPPRKQ